MLVLICFLLIFDIDVTKSCDCVLWAGDMNFRIDMSHKEVLEHYNERNFSELLLKDEFRMLQTRKGKSNVFFLFIFYYSIDDPYAEFKEGVIDFAPTYKFDLHSNDDTYDKHRIPSYTVRIKTENRNDKKLNTRRDRYEVFV
jgi:hypothetical protein